MLNNNLIHPLNFGGIKAPNNIFFAPLAGYSHKSARIFMRKQGAGYCVTEMVSIEGILRDSKKTFHYADIEDSPSLTSIQLFGCDPDCFIDAAYIVKEKFNAKSININFGCPAPKVQKGGGGSELLNTPEKMKSIVRALKKTGLTVEAKIRAGYDHDNLEHILDGVEDADCIILHCRLVKDKFLNGTANWDYFARARKHTNGILIANGDIKSPEQGTTVLNRYGVDGIMLGRAAIAKPYLFRQTAQYAAAGRFDSPSVLEKLVILKDYASLWCSTEGTDRIIPLRGALMSILDNFEGAVKLRSSIAACTTYNDLIKIIEFAQENYAKELVS